MVTRPSLVVTTKPRLLLVRDTPTLPFTDGGWLGATGAVSPKPPMPP